jgi:hypothetical protein
METVFTAEAHVVDGDFEWHDQGYVSQEHYQWPGIDPKLFKRYLRVTSDVLAKKPIRKYDPFVRDPGLYVLFSRLSGSEESIIEFVKSYGPLEDRVVDTSLGAYQSTIFALRDAEALRVAILEQDEKSLGKYVQWPRGRLQFSTRFVYESNTFPNLPAKIRSEIPLPFMRLNNQIANIRQAGFVAGDLLGPATELLDKVIESSVGGRLSSPASWGLAISPYRRADGQLVLRTKAPSLHDALWLQFAQATSKEYRFSFCTNCDKPILQNNKRSDTMFCSTLCRVKLFQRRQKKAKKLRAQGMSIAKIAKAVESSPTKVKGWLGKEGE